MLDLALLTIGLHLGTYHFDRGRERCEVNPGVYAVYDKWTAGVYHNSECSTSVYGGYTWRLPRTSIDVTAGAVFGYDKGPLPLVVPSYKLQNGPRLSLLLPLEKHGGGVHVSWEF